MASTRAAAAGERVRVGCTYSEARHGAARRIDAEFTAFVLQLYTPRRLLDYAALLPL